MTTEEFSNEFDTLVGAYTQKRDFGVSQLPNEFDEYEKSVFLTEAQQWIVTNLYNGKLTGDSFEKTEEMRRYLNPLVSTYQTDIQDKVYRTGLSPKSVFFHLPDDLLFITYESVELDDDTLGCKNGSTIEVIPVTQDDYHKIKENPFKQPNKRRALRLDAEDGIVEIISQYPVRNYLVRYLSRPSPIILVNLPDNLQIDGCGYISECELNPAIHRMILERAVQLAL